jgi:hypothetical protein
VIGNAINSPRKRQLFTARLYYLPFSRVLCLLYQFNMFELSDFKITMIHNIMNYLFSRRNVSKKLSHV